MSEFMQAPRGPSPCVACGNGNPPMVDTGRELHITGQGMVRVVVCSLCVKRSMRALGLLDGDKHDELLDASHQLAEKEKDVERLVGKVDELTDKLLLANITATQQKAELERLEQDNESLRGQLRGAARDFVALAGNDDE